MKVGALAFRKLGLRLKEVETEIGLGIKAFIFGTGLLALGGSIPLRFGFIFKRMGEGFCLSITKSGAAGFSGAESHWKLFS